MDLPANHEQLIAQLDTDLPSKVAVGGGTCMFVSGSCFHPDGDIEDLRVLVGKHEGAAITHGMPRIDRLRAIDAATGEGPSSHPPSGLSDRRRRAYRSGFWALVPIAAVELPEEAPVIMRATLGGGVVERHVADLELIPECTDLKPEEEAKTPQAHVAICMGTYEPPADLLERQLASLRNQSYRDWVCLISDDCSSAESFGYLRSLAGEDPRFIISRSPERLGFYRNFERALRMVPERVALVGLCDQDDYWYPSKLEQLVAGIGSASLIYSDARIVSASGKVLSDTCWTHQRNNHHNLASLLIANTVSGAASLFQRRLLNEALPFPPLHGRACHDHWLASVALATGRIAYIDRPLFDYVQHSSAIIGHPAGKGDAVQGASARRPARGGPVRPWRPLTQTPLRAIPAGLNRARRSYFWNVCRIALTAEALESRFGGRLDPRKRRVIDRMRRLGRPPEPTAWLALRALRRLFGLSETQYYEWSLLAGIAWRRATAAMVRLRRRPGRLLNRSDQFFVEGAAGEPTIGDGTRARMGAFLE